LYEGSLHEGSLYEGMANRASMTLRRQKSSSESGVIAQPSSMEISPGSDGQFARSLPKEPRSLSILA
jgi:hypothetical protein